MVLGPIGLHSVVSAGDSNDTQSTAMTGKHLKGLKDMSSPRERKVKSGTWDPRGTSGMLRRLKTPRGGGCQR